jgi:hypothetical protein
MGLDMYLEAKYKNQKNSGLRGACDGLFPIAPKSDYEEIGYWRKNYELSEFLWEQLNITEDMNCERIEMSEQDLLDVINFCEGKLKENPEWLNTIDIFDKALNLMRNEDATIYYLEWY